MSLSHVKEMRPRKPATAPSDQPPPPPIVAPTGNANLDVLADVVNRTAAPFQSAPPPEQGALGVISHGMGAVLGVVGAPFEMLDAGFAMATAGLAAMMPGLPAATLTAPHLGMPHGHAHPPSLIPPAPPVPLPSIGMVAAAGCVSVLVGGLPAARASDVGPAPTCGSFGPIFEVYTGSSNTFIGGSRAARMTDITRHCNPASALGAFGKAMGAVGVVAGAVGAGAQAAAGAAAAAAMIAAQAAADAVALAMSAFLGKDPGIPPAMGAVMMGNPMVLIGGFPVPDLLDLAGGLVSAAKKVGGAAKKVGKKAAKLKNQVCFDPSEPISLTSGEVYNDFADATLDPLLEWKWERHYRSGWADEVGPMGRGFRHSYEKRLELRRRTAVFVDHDGLEVDFSRSSDVEPYGGTTFGYVLRQLDELNFSLQTPGEGGAEYRFVRTDRRADRARLVEMRPGARKGESPRPPVWIEYDRGGKLVRLWRPTATGKLEARLHYDPRGRLISVERRAPGEPTTTLARYAYDDAQHLVAFRNALGAEYAYRYALHRMVRAQDPRGYGFTWTYDHLGRCIACRGDDGLWEVSIVYEVGRTIVTEADGGVWTYVYNDDRIITRIIDPGGGVKQYRVDERGIICQQIDPAGLVTRWLYDHHGHHYARMDPWGSLLPPENDDPNPATGRELVIPRAPRDMQLGAPETAQVRSTPQPDLDVVGIPAPLRSSASAVLWAATHKPAPPERRFDVAGNLVAERDAWGHEERTTYSPLGDPIQVTDADGAITRRTYDSWSLMVASTDPSGASTRYAYDHRERIVAITDPRGHTVKYERDRCGRVEKILNAGELEERYEHDAAGRVVATYDGDDRLLVSYAYGKHGQCETRTQASGEVHHYTYDHRGNICKASTDEIEVRLAYDWARRVVLDERDGEGISKRSLGLVGQVVSLFRRFETRYEVAAGTTTIVTPDGTSHQIRMLPGGTFERIHADGHHELSHFDGRGRCTGRYLWHDQRGDARWCARYRYSPAGELLKAEDSFRGTTTFAYDAAHRLKTVRSSDGREFEYRHDPAGNLVRNRFYPWLRTDARHQLVEGPSEAFTYDGRHQLASHSRDGVTANYHYGSLGRLARVTWDDGRPDWLAVYDGLGRRLYKDQGGKRTDFYWDGPRLAAEHSPEGTLRIYVYPTKDALVPIMFVDYDDAGADPAEGKRYTVFSDQVGQPTLIYDPEGTAVWASRHTDPYGAIDLDPSNLIEYALRFPGHYFDDETGLHDNRFRTYSPSLGRYLQSDPMGQAGGVHLYAYPANPLVHVDVFGLMHKKKPGDGPAAPDASGPKKKDPGSDAEGDAGKTRRTLSAEETAAIKKDLDAKAKAITDEMDAAWARGERTVPADRLPPGVTAPQPLKTKPVNDPKQGRGPCLTLTKDLDTGEVFVTQNQPGRPTKEHPLVTQRSNDRIESNQQNFDYKNEDWKNEGRTRSGRPGTHSEVHGVNEALNDRAARNAAGDHPPGKPFDESDMDGLVIHNTRTEEGPDKGAPMPRCHNCAPITDGAHALND